MRDYAGNDADLDLGFWAFNDNPNFRVNVTPVPMLPALGLVVLAIVLALGGRWRLLRR